MPRTRASLSTLLGRGLLLGDPLYLLYWEGPGGTKAWSLGVGLVGEDSSGARSSK